MRELTIDRVPHGPVRTAFHGRLKYHARGGMIEVIDQTTGSCQILKPAEFEKRCVDFEEFWKSCNPTGNGYERDFRFFQGQLLSGMRACIKEARSQGDPTDPKVRAWHARHARSSTVNTVAPVQNGSRAMAGDYPELGHMPGVAGCSLKRKPAFFVVQNN